MEKQERDAEIDRIQKNLKAYSGREVEYLSGLYADALIEALGDHAIALNKGAEASDKYANRLVLATWALFFATGGLIVTALIGLIIQLLAES